MEKIQYLNPITLEAEIFLNSLECLLKTGNSIDAVLISKLDKIMTSIGKFLDSAPIEIVETKNTELIRVDDLSKIKRIFCCTICNRDIGKSVEKLTLHIINLHSNIGRQRHDICDIVQIKTEPKLAPVKKQQKVLEDLRMEKYQKAKKSSQSQDQAVKLNKKTVYFLTANLGKFFEDQLTNGSRIKFLPAYDDVEKDLLHLVRPLFPKEKVKVYKFGSRIAGLGHPDSDLDLYVDIGDTFHIFQNRANKEALSKLQKVKNAIKNSTKWAGLVAIEKARVPILKIIHSSSGLECDINFSHSLGVINTQLLEYILNLQPIAIFLCCFMKKWLERARICEEINAYSINLIVIFYLQTLHLIPSVEQLQENITDEISSKIGPWICNFTTLSQKQLRLPSVQLDESNLLKHLKGFFLFCTNYNFTTHIICPYLGKSVKKKGFNKLMPSRFKLINDLCDSEFKSLTAIVVQDPIQLNHNTAKNVTKSTLKILKMHMIEALRIINEIYKENVE